jgi:hypothetical protein
MRTRHIPPGREALWRRQAEADAEIERLDAACDAAEKKARELAKVLDPDDSVVEDADEEFARLFDERNRAVAVADAVYRERTAGLTSWIDHDPTAPVCSECQGTGGPPGCDAHGACSTCRGWGREHREPIPVWSETAQAWVNPATGQTVDLLANADPKGAAVQNDQQDANGSDPTPVSKQNANRDRFRELVAERERERAAQHSRASDEAQRHLDRAGRWTQRIGRETRSNAPVPTSAAPTTTGSAGGAMASIEEVRASIMQGTQCLTDALGMLKQAESEIESGQQAIMHAVEGSGQNDAQEALGLLQRALESVAEVVQMVNAAAQSAEDVAARL